MPLNSTTPESDRKITAGTLYVVATPIGNLDDISLRALKILAAVDWIAAEDTRVTQKFLRYHGLHGRLISYHEHNEERRAPELVQRLAGGEAGALVSSAGTPAVSDPGYRLLRQAADAAIPISPVPGACAAVAGLSISGLPCDGFLFAGFAPRKRGRREALLSRLAEASQTVIFYESPKRIVSFLAELTHGWGDRPALLCREMTKPHEEFLRGRLSEIRAALEDRAAVKGEVTLLVAGRREEPAELSKPLRMELAAGLNAASHTKAQIVQTLSRRYGVPRNRLYAEALKIEASLRRRAKSTKPDAKGCGS